MSYIRLPIPLVILCMLHPYRSFERDKNLTPYSNGWGASGTLRLLFHGGHF